MEQKTEQDRLREVIAARKTSRKVAKVLIGGVAVVIAGILALFGAWIGAAVAAVVCIGIGAFVNYSFKVYDQQDLKRIAELDANPASGQGRAVRQVMGENGGLLRETQDALNALAATAAKMTDGKENILSAVGTLKEQCGAIAKSLLVLRQTMDTLHPEREDEAKTIEEMSAQEKELLGKLSYINSQAHELDLSLKKALTDDVADSGKIQDALRAIKVETATAASMKQL